MSINLNIFEGLPIARQLLRRSITNGSKQLIFNGKKKLILIPTAVLAFVNACKNSNVQDSGADAQTVSIPKVALWDKKQIQVCWEHYVPPAQSQSTTTKGIARKLNSTDAYGLTCDDKQDPQLSVGEFQQSVEKYVSENMNKTVIKLEG